MWNNYWLDWVLTASAQQYSRFDTSMLCVRLLMVWWNLTGRRLVSRCERLPRADPTVLQGRELLRSGCDLEGALW